MKQRTILAILAAIILPALAMAQYSSHYSRIVEELSSRRYHGRGYTNDGVRKAAQYVANRFRRCGVDSLIFQSYPIDINTFQGKMRLSVDHRRLKAGEEFVMREYSPGIHGAFPLYYIDTTSYDSQKIFGDLDKAQYRNAMVVCDFWFTYRHKEDFLLLQKRGGSHNAGLILKWSSPLRFYKAYGEKVADKPTIWVDNTFPCNASEIEADIDNTFLSGYESSNVIAMVKGLRHDSCYVFTAHYDHLGQLGRKIYFPGANDNASGTAAIITLAKHYVSIRPKFDMYFVALSGEETGLRGSTFLADHPVFELSRVRYLFNLDMIGDDNVIQYCETSEQGEQGFRTMERLNSVNHYFSSLKRGKLAANSDHYPFAMKGVPCIMLENEGGSIFPTYHTIGDEPQKIHTGTYESIFRMIVDYVAEDSTGR